MSKTFVYCVQISLVTILLSLIMRLQHCILYTCLYMLGNLPTRGIFFGSGAQIKIALLIYSVLPAYIKITSETMNIIWEVYSLLLPVLISAAASRALAKISLNLLG